VQKMARYGHPKTGITKILFPKTMIRRSEYCSYPNW
jgi:hypothetical protein